MVKTEIIDAQEKLDKLSKKLAKQRAFVFNTETTGLDPFTIKLLGISFCFEDGKAYYLDFKSEIRPRSTSPSAQSKVGGNSKSETNPKSKIQNPKSILENPKIEKYGHDLKYDFEVLHKNGLNLAGVAFDTMIAAYLLNPGARVYDLDPLVEAKLGEKITPLPALIGKGRKKISLEAVPVLNFAKYSCERAEATWRLVKVLKSELEETNLVKVFKEIEMPLLPVLAKMEIDGVKIDANLLKKYSEKAKKDLVKISEKIFKLAKIEFNLDSPVQLREVLFEKLKIKPAGLRRGKTGISTEAGELLKLRTSHPIIDLILEYRELAKLCSTYLDALPKMVDPKTGRIHTSFNQAITATGRLSSSKPNLQNIPTRSDLGQMVRRAFVASPGSKILAADYAHIELRIIASLANDKKMIAAFRAGKDIHRETASQIWGVPPEEVTPELRRAAKTINFGVTYGMGARGLAEAAGISFDEAKKFIGRYFTVYEGIKNFIEETRRTAQDLGYVETFFGRRRYLPEIFSEIPMVRAEAERMAVNMPVQGTAADIMKLAMIAVAAGLPKISPRSKMILQVHDELVFEAPAAEIKKVARFVKKTMEKVIKLKVPIVAEVEMGDNWGEMKKVKS
jgi:DNA polymerase-1